MNKFLGLFSLGSWQLLALLAFLSAASGGFLAWQINSWRLDDKITQAQLSLANYKNSVLQDTVKTNQDTLSEYKKLSQSLVDITDKYQMISVQQAADSQSLLKGLQNVSIKSCPISDSVEQYITGLHNLQQLHNP